MNHSFHYFANSVIFDRINNNIIDKKSGVLVLRLCNLCNFSEIYKPVLEKTMIKKKSLVNYKKWFGFRDISSDTAYNYKVRVDINFNKIREYLKSGFEVPQRNFLFKLLRRNIKRNDEPIHSLEKINKSIQPGELITYFSDNIIECDNLFFDIELERIYLSSNDIVRNKHNIIGNTTFWFYNSYSKFYDLFKDNSDFIILTKNPNEYEKILDITNVDTTKNFKFNSNSNNRGYLLDVTEVNTTEEDLVNYIERKRYEYSFINQSELDKKIVIPQLLQYSTVILDHSVLDNQEYSSIVKSFIDSKKIIILNKYFYKYRISDIAKWFNLIGSNVVVSRDFIRKILKISHIEQIKLDNSKFKNKIVNSTQYEKDYLIKFKNKFKIEIFNSLPFNYLKNYYTSVSLLPEEPCSICFDEINTNSLGKSQNCQHTFCFNCLNKAVKLNGKCPICREPTKAQKGVIGDLTSYEGKKIKFIKDFFRENKEGDIIIVSKYCNTRETLNEIFSEQKMKSYSYKKLETLETSGKTFIFMEGLTEENKYLKYLLSNSKCIFLNYKHN